MVDIFISYSRADTEKSIQLANELESHGWSVFWDRRVPAGKTWRNTIGRALAEARCVLVLWSRDSVNSDWVLEEAAVAKDKGILIAIRIDDVKPPFGFRSIQSVDLSNWADRIESNAYITLHNDISHLVSSSRFSKEPILWEEPILRSDVSYHFLTRLLKNFGSSKEKDIDLRQKLNAIERNYDLPGLERLRDSLGDLRSLSEAELRAIYSVSEHIGDWNGVVYVYELLPEKLRQEDHFRLSAANAYCTLGRYSDASTLLEPMVRDKPSAEAFAILARTYKNKATDDSSSQPSSSRECLRRAAEAYLRSFELDYNNYASALNAASILAQLGEKRRVIAVVTKLRSILEKMIKEDPNDYRVLAALLETYVLENNREDAAAILPRIFSASKEVWHITAVRANLEHLEKSFGQLYVDSAWLTSLIDNIRRWEARR